MAFYSEKLRQEKYSYSEEELLKIILYQAEKSILDNLKQKDFDYPLIIENDIYVTSNYINNVLLYDLHEYDSVEFIKSLNLDECKKMLNELDYSNYTILINKEKDN